LWIFRFAILSEPPKLGHCCRLNFGDSSELAGIMDPGYTLRLEDEGAVSVVAAAHDAPGDDEADSVAVGKQRPGGVVQPEESAGEVGE
jgi:hypothetical protein